MVRRMVDWLLVIREPQPLPDTCQNTPSKQGGVSRLNFFPPNWRSGSLTYMGGSIWKPPWMSHLYGGKHLEATLGPSLIWGEASGGHPGSLTYMEGSIWRPPWIPHLYEGKHLEATLDLSLIWGEASGGL